MQDVLGNLLSRRNQIALALFAVVFVGSVLFPSGEIIFPRNSPHFLSLHSAVEGFSIIVSILAFVIAWENKSERKFLNIMIVGVVFLAVGLIDFGHALSYKGMPQFISPSSSAKAIYFWICGRLLVAFSMLYLATSKPRHLRSERSRFTLLFIAAIVVLGIFWVGLFHLHLMPETFIEGEGLTPFKLYTEAFIIGILILALLALVKRHSLLAQSYSVENILMAISLMIISEMYFMIYEDVSDVYNFAGHIFKIISYFYFYRALFRDSINKPYRLLDEKNRELEIARKVADSASVAKTQFLANMSHEIRTPLNSIMGMTELLGDTSLNEEQKRYVSILKGAGDHLLNLVNDVLDLSRIEAGYLDLRITEFNVVAAINYLEQLLKVAATKKNLPLTFKVSPDVPQVVMGDLNKFNRIIINLVGNAIKFTEKGSVDVEVSVLSRTELDVELFIAVRDTGIGIPADKIESLFQNFYQLDNSSTRSYGGTGLGLAISKKLAEAMRGKIKVESKPGMGSVFSVTLVLGLVSSENPHS